VTVHVAYRHAAYDTPWSVIASSRESRFSAAFEDDATQYLALHPLGPTAELLRHSLRGPHPDRADLLLANLWAMLVDVEGTLGVTFDNCADYGITPRELVGEDYEPTRAFAARLRRDGVPGFTVPSAALPGTDNLVLFGPRVAHPYLETPVSPEECPTGHLSDGAHPTRELLPFVRWKGEPHTALEQWEATGTYPTLDDPLAVRW
jgi:hypothetical protein